MGYPIHKNVVANNKNGRSAHLDDVSNRVLVRKPGERANLNVAIRVPVTIRCTMKPARPTRTAKTSLAYRAIAERASRLAAEGGHDSAVSWLTAVAHTLSRATVNLYRAALVVEFHHDPIVRKSLDLAYASSRRGRTGRTSSRKAKHFAPSAWSALQVILEAHPPDSAGAWALRWLRAASLTGLRPCEWPGAQLDLSANPPALSVLNRKSTNGRSFGPVRVLTLEGLSLAELHFLADWCRFCERHAQQWDHIYEVTRKALQRAVDQLRPKPNKRITLYTGRHQLAADAKASGRSKTEVAALLGQASLETAGRHYGKKRYGHPGALRVSPSNRDVQTVEALNITPVQPSESPAFGTETPTPEPSPPE